MSEIIIREDEQTLVIETVTINRIPNPWNIENEPQVINGAVLINGELQGGSSPFILRTLQSTVADPGFQFVVDEVLTGKLAQFINDGGSVLDIGAEGDIRIGTFTNATRPAFGEAGRVIWNSDSVELQVDTGAAWESVGGGGVSDPLLVNGWSPASGIATITGAQDLIGQAAPALSGAGNVRLYFDSGANKLKISENNGAFVDVISALPDPITVDGWSPTSNIGTFNGALDVAEQAAPAVSAAGDVRLYFDSTSKKLQASENGGTFVDVITPPIADPITVNGWTPAGGTATITGNLTLTGTLVGGSSPFLIESKEADSGSAIGFEINTQNTLTTAGSKIVSIKNNTVEKNYFDKDGNLYFPAANQKIHFSGGGRTHTIENIGNNFVYRSHSGTHDFRSSGSTFSGDIGCNKIAIKTWIAPTSNGSHLHLRSLEQDGPNVFAFEFNVGFTLSNETADLATFKNDNTEVFQIDKEGAIALNVNGGTKPAASVSHRGKLYVEQGGGGSRDSIFICLKSDSDTYSWVSIVDGGA